MSGSMKQIRIVLLIFAAYLFILLMLTSEQVCAASKYISSFKAFTPKNSNITTIRCTWKKEVKGTSYYKLTYKYYRGKKKTVKLRAGARSYTIKKLKKKLKNPKLKI